MDKIIPDVLKVPLAFTAMNIPNCIMQHQERKKQLENEQKVTEEMIKQHNEAVKSLWEW